VSDQPTPALTCLFCDKPQREVKHLVACDKEGVVICDECIGVAMRTLAVKGWIPPSVTITIRPPDAITCPECDAEITEFEVKP